MYRIEITLFPHFRAIFCFKAKQILRNLMLVCPYKLWNPDNCNLITENPIQAGFSLLCKNRL